MESTTETCMGRKSCYVPATSHGVCLVAASTCISMPVQRSHRLPHPSCRALLASLLCNSTSPLDFINADGATKTGPNFKRLLTIMLNSISRWNVFGQWISTSNQPGGATCSLLTMIRTDIDYMNQYRDFDNDAIRFGYPEGERFLSKLHANGQHYIPIVDAAIYIPNPNNASDA